MSVLTALDQVAGGLGHAAGVTRRVHSAALQEKATKKS